jgi:TetR/AcrR family transcriptional regulator
MPPHAAPDLRPRHEATRDAILRAAVREFSEQGPAGARMDAIARAAGVNKALLHYYFSTKEGLYAAVVDEIFGSVRDWALALLQREGTPGERLLRYFLAHFDRIALGDNARLMAYEMMRAREGQSSNIPRMARTLFGPVYQALYAAFKEGREQGELGEADPEQVFLALIGMNVFYFISAPVFKEVTGADPRAPESLLRQRAGMLTFAADALFADPGRGRAASQALLVRFPHTSVAPQGLRP